jgi:arylsulfatase A-like enzyme
MKWFAVAGLVLLNVAFAHGIAAQEVLPQPAAFFEGVIGRTYLDSVPDRRRPIRPPQGAPNVIIIVLDDLGFGQLGAYGGPIETPNMDRLASGGLRYHNFHTAGLGAPTRAALLTGRNPHSVGFSVNPQWATGYPGSDGIIRKSAATLAEVLKLSGYNTFAVGKWQLAPCFATTGAGPFDQWPLGLGFERFYGFLAGETDQWAPALSEDNHRIEPPRRPDYHLSADLTDKAIAYLRDQQQAGTGRPFFLYLAYAAGHAPLQAPQQWLDKYNGRFDQGWDQVRAETFDRQKSLGIIPKNSLLPLRDSGIRPWNELTPAEKRLFVRLQQAFAGLLSYTDYHIGRLMASLSDMGLMENTLILVLSDNGGSGEGGAAGTTNLERLHNDLAMTVEEMLHDSDGIGGSQTAPQYPAGWAAAGNVPFKGWKLDIQRGGTAVPFIIHWPRKIKDAGKIRTQYHHVADVMPTVLEAVGLAPPAKVNGVDQQPLEGVSMVYSFADAKAPTQKRVQYYELFGARAIWAEGWEAVAAHAPGTPYVEDRWALYYADEDFTQSKDLAQQRPDRLRELIELWWTEAGKHHVLPLDDRRRERDGGCPRPGADAERKRYEVYPGTSPVPNGVAPKLIDRSHTIAAEVRVPREGAEGLLVAQGGRFGGWAFFVKHRKLHYVHNLLKMRFYEITSNEELPTGPLRLRFEFTRTGTNTGTGTLFVNGRQVGRLKEINTATREYGMAAGDGLQVGRSWGTPVSPAYEGAFAFTGELKKVTIEVKEYRDQLRQREGRK